MSAKVVKAAFPSHALHLPKKWPSHWRVPYIFASPHSGRDYPGVFLNNSILDLAELRRSEDAYVDLLLPDPETFGIPVLCARFPRAFVDVNRSPREIDPFMFTTLPRGGDGDKGQTESWPGLGPSPNMPRRGGPFTPES